MCEGFMLLCESSTGILEIFIRQRTVLSLFLLFVYLSLLDWFILTFISMIEFLPNDVTSSNLSLHVNNNITWWRFESFIFLYKIE